MPRQVLSNDKALQVLATQNIVRVAFRDGSSSYLIPLGYVWLPSALYGVSEAGHKTQLAEKDPNVSFQVDTSNSTGVFQWQSVTGQGKFEIVANDEQKQKVWQALNPIMQTAPNWWLQQQAPHLASGDLLVWKITPSNITGCECAQPDDQ